jgi:hypothetical protein
MEGRKTYARGLDNSGNIEGKTAPFKFQLTVPRKPLVVIG